MSPPRSEIEDRLFTRKEVAWLLEVHRATIWQWEKRGLVFIMGRVKASALADFLVAETARQKAALQARPQAQRRPGATPCDT